MDGLLRCSVDDRNRDLSIRARVGRRPLYHSDAGTQLSPAKPTGGSRIGVQETHEVGARRSTRLREPWTNVSAGWQILGGREGATPGERTGPREHGGRSGVGKALLAYGTSFGCAGNTRGTPPRQYQQCSRAVRA